MSGENTNSTNLSPTVAQVIDEFVNVMHADEAIDDLAVDRLGKILRETASLKADDIHSALFGGSEGEKKA